MKRVVRNEGSHDVKRRAFLQTASAIVAGGLSAIESRAETRQVASASLRGVRAMTFDVFGTVVDWRSSIISEMEELARTKGIEGDWAAFADQWRAGYGPAMRRVRGGDLPWTKIDDLHRMILDTLVPEFGLQSLSAAELDDLNLAWHRLRPWPDSVAGLTRLKAGYVLATLSNGNVALLVNMAKRAGLPWDAVLSAELAGAYKPDREVYVKAADLLGLNPEQVMMVAAHTGDLRAAAEVGFRTAFVPRPLEYGPDGDSDVTPDPAFDLVRAQRGSASAVIVKRLVLPVGVWSRVPHEPNPRFADDAGTTRDAARLDSSGHDSAARGVAEPDRGARG